MAEGVSIKEEKKNGVLILSFQGRLDAISTPDTEKKVFTYIDNKENKILFNFAGVEHISSAGLRMLLASAKRLKAIAGLLVICGINPNVMDVLKMSGFDHIIELTKTEEDGLKRF